MRLLTCLGMGLLVSAVAERPAEACSCATERRASPADGAADVPTNAEVVFATGDEEPVLGLRRTDTLEEVPITVEVLREPADRISRQVLHIVRHAELLEPDTRYDLTTRGGTFATFTTGDGLDATAPAFAGVTAAQFRRWRADGSWNSSCWEVDDGTDQVLIDHAPLPGDAVRARIDVTGGGETWTGMRFLPSAFTADDTLTRLSSDSCWDLGAPVLRSGVAYCARVTVFDAAGNATDGGEVCEQARDCAFGDEESPGPDAPCMAPSTGCRASPGRRGAGWLAGLVAGASMGAAWLWRRRRTRLRAS